VAWHRRVIQFATGKSVAHEFHRFIQVNGGRAMAAQMHDAAGVCFLNGYDVQRVHDVMPAMNVSEMKKAHNRSRSTCAGLYGARAAMPEFTRRIFAIAALNGNSR
jgi:hypothetical protein